MLSKRNLKIRKRKARSLSCQRKNWWVAFSIDELIFDLFWQNEEDQALKEKLELCVERLSDRDAGLRQKALDMIKEEIRTATTSMTSVPKPLKFCSPLYPKLVEAHKNYTSADAFKVSQRNGNPNCVNQFYYLLRKILQTYAQSLPWWQLPTTP